MSQVFAADHAPAVVAAWCAFSAHAGECEDCAVVAVRVRTHGGPVNLDDALAPLCGDGRPLLEAWYAACETYMEVVRENAGRVRRLA